MSLSQMSVLSSPLSLTNDELYVSHTSELKRRPLSRTMAMTTTMTTTTTTPTTPTLTLRPSYSKMNPLTPKFDAQWPTPTIPRCLCRHCVLGSSACFSPSSFRAQTGSSSSDTLLSASPRFVFLSLFCHICWTVAESSPPCEIKRITLLLSFLMGKLWARYVPTVSLFGISLNPGPFTVKEHVIITIMAGIGAAPAYAVSIATVSQIISTLSHQFLSDRCYCRPKGSL